MQSDLFSGGNDRLDRLESQEMDASSEVSVCLLVKVANHVVSMIGFTDFLNQSNNS